MKISAVKIKSVYASVQDISNVLNENTELNYYFFPFTIILGNVNTTETGYKDNYSIPNDYFSFAKVFTGQEAILAVWDDSYTLTPSESIINKTKGNVDNAKDFYYTKTFQVGHTFQGIWKSDSLSLDFTASAQNSGFTSEQVVKQVSLIVKNDDTNKQFIDEITNNIFKLYALPEINKIKDALPPTGNDGLQNEIRNPYSTRYDRQWYYISNIIKTHNSSDKTVAFCEVEFTSLNDKLAHTGLAVNQYVQAGAPGEPFAYPTFDSTDTNKIILDSSLLIPLPITHAQVTFYGSAGVNNLTFMGREVLVNNISPQNTIRIGTPGLIFPHIYQSPVYDNLSLKAVATNSYYMVAAEPVIDTYFANWRDNIAGKQLFDESNQKIFEGHIRSIKTESRATNNASEAGSHHRPYWDAKFLRDDSSKLTTPLTFNVENNPYFIYQHENSTKIGDTKKLTYGNQSSFADYNMYNYFSAFQTYQIPLNVRETTPVTLNSLPVVGGFLNKLFVGIPVGYKTAVSSLPNNIIFYVLWSCGIYDNYSDVLYTENNARNESIVPYNAFDNSNNRIGALVGSQSQTTSFAFSLTNNISAVKWNKDGTKVSDKVVPISSYNLSTLSQDSDGDHIYLLSPNSVLGYKQGDVIGYYIDSFNFQSYFKGNYKVEFFSNPFLPDAPIDEKNAVWVGTYTTFAALTNNIRLWTELKQLSDPTYDFNGHLSPYPEAIQTPNPAEANILSISHDYLYKVDTPTTVLDKTVRAFKFTQQYFIASVNEIVPLEIPTAPDGFKFTSVSNVTILRRANDSGSLVKILVEDKADPSDKGTFQLYLNTYTTTGSTDATFSGYQMAPLRPSNGYLNSTTYFHAAILPHNNFSVSLLYQIYSDTESGGSISSPTRWTIQVTGNPTVQFRYTVNYTKTT